MPNDNSEINDIVTKHAEEFKTQNTNTGDQSQGSQQQGGDLSEEQKATAAALEQENAAKAEAEKNAGKQDDTLTALLKELQLGSIDELKEKLNKPAEKELTPAEKEKAEALYEAELQKFAVENGKMKLDDFHQLKTVQAKKDAELVFETYLEDWKAENPEVKEDVEIEARKEFDREYHLNSENAKQKERGVKKLAKDAAEFRTPLESSYKTVKSEFDTEQQVRKEFPVFAKKIESIVKSGVPETVEWFKGKDGDDEVSVDIPLDEKERTEIMTAAAKKINSNQNFLLHKSGKEEELNAVSKEIIDNLIEKKIAEKGKAALADKYMKLGRAKGSTTGAENSFATNQAKAAAEQEKGNKGVKTGTEADQAVLAQFGQK